MLRLSALILSISATSLRVHAHTLVPADELPQPFAMDVKCRAFGPEVAQQEEKQSHCWPSDNCRRKIIDGQFSADEISGLVAIADKGIALREKHGGPTIVDINTGYIRDTSGLDNMFAKNSDIFTSEDFELYGNVIKRLKAVVMDTFEIDSLFFTAPTFITKIDATVDWTPSG